VPTSAATAATSAERECLRAAGLIALGGAAAAVLLWASTFPGWPIAAGVILSVFVLAGLLVAWGAEPQPAARWLRPAGLVLALILAVGAGVVVHASTQAALAVRFERSRPAFEAVIGAAGPVPTAVTDHWLPFPGDCPDQIGSYRIAECHAFTGGFMFLQRRSALGDEAGFAYAPHGLPATGDEGFGLPATGFIPIAPRWYAWSCDC